MNLHNDIIITIIVIITTIILSLLLLLLLLLSLFVFVFVFPQNKKFVPLTAKKKKKLFHLPFEIWLKSVCVFYGCYRM